MRILIALLSLTLGKLSEVGRNNDANEGIGRMGWHFLAQAGNENIVTSPFSIAGVLHMLAAGTQGDTRLQLIEKGLGLSYKEYRYRNGAFNFKKLSKSYRNFVDDIKTNKGDENYKCNIFNGVYHQKDTDFQSVGNRRMDPQFIRFINQGYVKDLGEIKSVDFRNDPEGSVQYINGRVAEATNDLIKNILPQSDEILAAVVSAIYLESKWKKLPGQITAHFEEVPKSITSQNTDYDFIRSYDNEESFPQIDSQKIDWIKTSSGIMTGFIRYAKTNDFDVFRLELESKGNQKLYFYALQHINLIEGMAEFEKSGDMLQLSKFMSDADQGENLEGVFHIPKFKIGFKKNLNQWLEELGVRRIFTKGEADMSPMLPNLKDEAFVRYMTHDATFALDSTGIKAAAATAASISDKSHDSELNKEYFLNSPFYFVLAFHESISGRNVPLFMGKVIDPTPAQ